jgi:hypothetical protein
MRTRPKKLCPGNGPTTRSPSPSDGHHVPAATLRSFYQQSPGAPPPKVGFYCCRKVAEILRSAYAHDPKGETATA